MIHVCALTPPQQLGCLFAARQPQAEGPNQVSVNPTPTASLPRRASSSWACF